MTSPAATAPRAQAKPTTWPVETTSARLLPEEDGRRALVLLQGYFHQRRSSAPRWDVFASGLAVEVTVAAQATASVCSKRASIRARSVTNTTLGTVPRSSPRLTCGGGVKGSWAVREVDIVWALKGEGTMAGASGDDSTGRLWAWLGGIASLIAILTWLGVSNAQELKEVLTGASPPSSSSGPREPSETLRAPDGPESDADTGGPDSDDNFGGVSNKPESKISSPTPDPTEESFKGVSVGECLAVYDTGRGGNGIDWSADVPPDPVSCAASTALVQVTSTNATNCPISAGKSAWTYTSAVSGETTNLCVSRIYRKHYCVLGKQVGGDIQLGSMTAVDCKAQRIPAAYDRIIHIRGVYQAPPGGNARNCVEGAADQTQYLAWLVDDSKTLLCGTIFQGG